MEEKIKIQSNVGRCKITDGGCVPMDFCVKSFTLFLIQKNKLFVICSTEEESVLFLHYKNGDKPITDMGMVWILTHDCTPKC